MQSIYHYLLAEASIFLHLQPFQNFEKNLLILLRFFHKPISSRRFPGALYPYLFSLHRFPSIAGCRGDGANPEGAQGQESAIDPGEDGVAASKYATAEGEER